jgi:sugar lactone lactonase YvrE
MNRNALCCLQSVFLLLFLQLFRNTPAFAVNPQFWTNSAFADLSKGDLKGLSLSKEGQLSLAPKFESVFDTDQALIWSAAYDEKKNLYVGTGHDGKVFKIDSQGTSSLFFDAAELDVLAMAWGNDQNLYVATSPDGKIYKVNSEGKGSVFFDPDDKFIWDLIFDAKGTLYVATGSKGKIYKVTKEGKGDLFYESGQTNLMCLALDSSQNLIVGSDPDGYVYRISPEGKAFVLYDSAMREVHDVTLDSQGNIYFIAMNPSGVSGSSAEPKSSGGEMISGDAAISVTLSVPAGPDRKPIEEVPSAKPPAARATRQEGGGSKSMIYRILNDNSIETLWSSDSEAAYAIHLQGEGKLLFSTGTKGRVYALDKDKKLTLLLETTEEQTTRLIPAGEDLFACTSNLGKVYRLGKAVNSHGSYESEVRDTQSISTWGNVSWRAVVPSGTSVKVHTRSGNTKKPDKTWSDWSKAYVSAEGEVIQSPRARYLQYKAVLESSNGRSPRLDQIMIPYLQQNFAPEVKSINILPPGVAYQRAAGVSAPRSQSSLVDQGSAEASGASEAIPQTASSSIPPRRVFQKGAQSFSWEAEDRNADDLTFSFYFRGEKESDWKLLRKDLDEKFLTLESDTLPDGKYQVRVVASDAPSNPRVNALTGELTSAVFNIDNTPPQIQVSSQAVQERSAVVRFKASDGVSALRKAETSVDGKEWETVFSVDGIVDAKSEEFEIKTEPLPSGEHTVALRVYDSNGNVAIGKAVVQVK